MYDNRYIKRILILIVYKIRVSVYLKIKKITEIRCFNVSLCYFLYLNFDPRTFL